MNDSIKRPETEQEKVALLAQELSEKGYETIIEPSTDDLPFSLGGYRPDLVAFKGHGGIIFEIRKSYTRLSVDRFQDISERIAAHNGWQFTLVTLDDATEHALISGQSDLPDWPVLQEKTIKIQTLLQNSMLEPALLYLWSTLESALRKRAIFLKLPIEKFQSNHLLNHMYSSGELSIDEFDFLKSIYQKRNRVAHGLDTLLTPKELDKLLAITHALMGNWQEAPIAAA